MIYEIYAKINFSFCENEKSEKELYINKIFIFWVIFDSNFPYTNLIKMSSEKKVYKLNISGKDFDSREC